MAYLRKEDYFHLIQELNLDQITSENYDLLDKCQDIAIAQIKGYLAARFEVDSELKDLSAWAHNIDYTGGDIVYLVADDYDSGTSYVENNLVTYEDQVYICIQDGVDEIGNDLYWAVCGGYNEIYSVKYPNPQFNYLTTYAVGDVVFYKGKDYTAVRAGSGVKPDDEINGSTYWGAGVAYLFREVLPNDTSKFDNKDYRNAQLLMTAIDLALYHIHKRISPRNIPDLRVKCYDDSIAWLDKCARGTIIPNIELIRPKSETSGVRTRFGYSAKNSNNY